ncbi:Pfs, NACHT and ankyrin domain protein [Mycena venus]|uniref:Pfs, NACHT and ankyrin domain protein n=1 Tax=Mycena venus TaxID=2733690 RepID=A0A8H6WUD1_9AGAR|nr:Pfs, NACHT and ankyrin domain protein [Mycena venus]
MLPLESESAGTPLVTTRPETIQVMQKPNTALEVAFDILKLLSGITENVPYLGIITGCVKRLIEIYKVVSDDETRASELLNNIFNVSHVLAKGLHDLHGQDRIAVSGLKNVLEKYQICLSETYHILEKWTSKSQIQPFAYADFLSIADGEDPETWTSSSRVQLVTHADFLGIADGIERRLNAFLDAFDASRLTDLSTSEDASTTNVSIQGGIGGPGGPGPVGGTGGIGEGPRITVFRPQISNMTVHGDVTNSPSNPRKRLEKWLSPAKVAISQHDAAQKRHPNTGLWLFKRMEFMGWIYAQNSLLWLQGISGSGKTVLSSSIIDTLRVRAEPLAFFYFDTNNSEQREVTQLLRSLVWQLSARGPSPDTILDTLWSSYSDGQLLPTNTVLISDALILILKKFTEPVYIVLDALDECSERDRLLTTITTILDANLPNVHILLTSRPEVPRTSTNLAERAVLLSLQDFTHQDIELYLTQQLSDFDYGWSVKRQGEIKKSLLYRGSGMFRLVSLQLDELRNCNGSDHEINEALVTMPSSLDVIYERIIKNIKKPAMVDAVLRAMNWLIFSEDPLTVEEIVDALAFDFDQEPLRFSKARRMQPKPLLQACAGFVTVSQEGWNNGHIKLAHASVKEYFLSQKAPRDAFSDHQRISEQTAHHLLARTCISYLCSIDHLLEKDTYRQQYPLARYAISYWSFHLKLCDEIRLAHYEGSSVRSSRAQSSVVPKTGNLNRKTLRLVDRVLELFQADSTPYLNLSRLDDPDPKENRRWMWQWERRWEPEPILLPLYRSVFVGVGPLVRGLLERGGDVNAVGGYYGNALQAASGRGEIEIARLLLEHGAEVNAQGGKYGDALQAALLRVHNEMERYFRIGSAEREAKQGDFEMVRLLLEHGADVNAQRGEHGNALYAACWKGHIEIVHLLLQHGAEVNVKGKEDDNALYAATSKGHIETVRLLLEHGAEVNAQGGKYGNALQAASSEGDVDIMHLLLKHGAVMNAQGGEYGNALQAASLGGDVGIVRLLLEHGAEVNAQGGKYGNALQAASLGGDVKLVRLLLEHGAEINAQGGKYSSALQAASSEWHGKIVQLLLEHGAEVNTQGGKYGNALQAASLGGDVNILRLLLEHGTEVNAQGGEYGNALQAASSTWHIKTVQLLLEHSAEVNTQGGEYGNALQAAASEGHIKTVQLLLKHGAEVNAQGGKYNNALQAASSEGHIKTVQLLLENGAMAIRERKERKVQTDKMRRRR